ncbi:hypothetical protein CK203_011035 [Vitis vinifera]|uniref:Uncharacterized protein n=1 Tax=Vitis vinifera TaxID=29760 RepID=A0A438JIU5_VITVI|nr:hypothetical protein CK203_011035 [Vitis vinifera]
MEEKPLCYASARILFWKLSVAANTIQSNKDVCVHAFSVSAKAENCISLYSSESASSGRGLGCIFSVSKKEVILSCYSESISVVLQDEKENKFSIFVHSRPGFLLNKATTRSVYFLNRQLNDSIQVALPLGSELKIQGSYFEI